MGFNRYHLDQSSRQYRNDICQSGTLYLGVPHDYFTVSFFPEQYREDLQYLGTHSGRDEDKVAKTSLTPVAAGESVTFKEAELTFVCKKIYAAQFDKDKMDPEVYETTYGYRDWITHYEFIGKVVDVIE